MSSIKPTTDELTFLLSPSLKRVMQHFEIINQTNETRIFKFRITNPKRYVIQPIISALKPLARMRIEILCDVNKLIEEKPNMEKFSDKLALFSLPGPLNYESLDQNKFIKDNMAKVEQKVILLNVKIQLNQTKTDPEFKELPKGDKVAQENPSQNLTESVTDPSFNRFESIIPLAQKEVLTTSVAKDVVLEDQTPKQSIDTPKEEGDVVFQLKRRIFMLENQLKESSVG